MSLDLKLLDVLADAEFHSGSALGERIGVSRAAVWKQLQRIQEQTGLHFDSVKGRGYRLSQGIELLDVEAIRGLVSAEAQPMLVVLERHLQIDSTNRLAMTRATEGASSGHVVVAEQQLAGRGRRGRPWVSPFGANLYMSVIWSFEGGVAALEGLSLVVGVAVARALSELGGDCIGLKWPNDVQWQGRKLGGILIEMTGDADGSCQVIIGIGINVSMPEDQALAIDQPWCDLQEACGKKISRNGLAAATLSHLLPVLNRFEYERFDHYRDEWRALDCTLGHDVSVRLGDRVVMGLSAGVGAAGELLVDTESGRESFHGGEVSLRLRR